MNPNRKTAIIVGVLYIIGTVTGILSVVITTPILDSPDYLVEISANGTQIIAGALLVLMMGLALAMIPVVMFPILKKHNEALALGYVIFRGGLETVLSIVMAISSLLLLVVSQEYVQAGAADSSYLQTLGTLLRGVNDYPLDPILAIVFPLGALMFYYLLYQSKLLPRWLSGWGLITAIPYLAAALLVTLRLLAPWSTIRVVLVLPLALQEMVMAVWLLVKGFNSSVTVSSPSAQKVVPEV